MLKNRSNHSEQKQTIHKIWNHNKPKHAIINKAMMNELINDKGDPLITHIISQEQTNTYIPQVRWSRYLAGYHVPPSSMSPPHSF